MLSWCGASFTLSFLFIGSFVVNSLVQGKLWVLKHTQSKKMSIQAWFAFPNVCNGCHTQTVLVGYGWKKI